VSSNKRRLLEGLIEKKTSKRPAALRQLMREFHPAVPSEEVDPAMLSWVVQDDPRRLRRIYTFGNQGELVGFVWQLLTYQERVQHHADIRLTIGRVEIEVYTRDLDDITNADKDYAKTADLIYSEALNK